MVSGRGYQRLEVVRKPPMILLFDFCSTLFQTFLSLFFTVAMP